MAEWLKAHAWKVCLGLNLTWVRIPPPPPNTKNPHQAGFLCLAQGVVLVRTYGSTKTSGKFLNKLCLARKAGEGMDRPNTNCLEQFAPPLAPEGSGTRKCLSESRPVVVTTNNSDTLKLSVFCVCWCWSG